MRPSSRPTARSGSSLLRALTITLAATAVAAKSKTKTAQAAAATKANTIEIVGLTGVSGECAFGCDMPGGRGAALPAGASGWSWAIGSP